MDIAIMWQMMKIKDKKWACPTFLFYRTNIHVKLSSIIIKGLKVKMMSVKECRKYLPELNHLPDSEIIKIRDYLIEIVNLALNTAMKEYKR